MALTADFAARVETTDSAFVDAEDRTATNDDGSLELGNRAMTLAVAEGGMAIAALDEPMASNAGLADALGEEALGEETAPAESEAGEGGESAPEAGAPPAVEQPAAGSQGGAGEGAPGSTGAGAAPDAGPAPEAPPEQVDPTAVASEEIPSEPPPPTPQDDPAFQEMEGGIRQTGTAERQHEAPTRSAGAAQSAAVSPADERTSLASAGRTAETESTETPPFDTEAFVAKVMEKVQSAAPSSMSEARDYADGGLDDTKSDLVGASQAETAAATDPLEAANQAPPDPNSVPERQPTPLQAQDPGPAPAAPPPSGAAPPPRPHEQVVGENEAISEDIDAQLADEEITEETLANSNEPEFTAALGEKNQAQAAAAAAPAEFRQEEAGMSAGAREDSATMMSDVTESMHSDRVTSMSTVTGDQETTRSEDEAKRAEVAAHIEGIYQQTKQRVEARLAQLDRDVNDAFEAGIEHAKQGFEDYYESAMDDRYSGVSGKLRWLDDKIFGGLVGPVKRILAAAQAIFLERMDAAVRNVAQIVSVGLTEAKEIVAEGRAEIQEYVASLPQDLQAIGQEAASAIEDKFSELESAIDEKESQLIDSVAARYTEAMSEINDRMEEIKEASKSLLERARDMVVGVINAIRNLKNLLLDVLSSVGDAITTIISDPIGFLSNLVSGAIQGLEDFLSGIIDHVKNAFFDWLFGTAAAAGIQMPDSLDAEGIFSLITQILGLTYQNLRARAVAIVGEPIVERLEQFAEPIIVLMNEGFDGLWDWIQEKVAAIADAVWQGILDFLTESVIVAGIKWLIGILNPAAAFIKACMAIYDIVMFIVERGRDIIELVQAFIAGVGEVARGNVSGIASKVKDALVQALPIVISFLARLLGLGNVSQKIREIIDTIQEPVNEAMDWLIEKAVGLIRAAGKLIGLGPDEGEEQSDEDAEEAENGEADSDLEPIVVDEPVDLLGTSHEVTTHPGSSALFLESTPKPLAEHHDAGVRSLYSDYLQVARDEALEGSTRQDRVNEKLTPLITAVKAAGLDPAAPGFSAPGIGDVAPWGSQQSKLYAHGIELWKLRAEHVLARSIVNEYLMAFLGPDAALSEPEYESQSTILIYFHASKTKDFHPDAGDLTHLRQLRAQIPRQSEEPLDLVDQFAVNEYASRTESMDRASLRAEFAAIIDEVLAASVDVTMAGVDAEASTSGQLRGETGSVPSSSEVQYAAQVQRAEIMAQVDVRLSELFG